MNTVENIGDHLAYTCQCGGVNFCLLRSGNVECNKCQDRPGMTWAYEEKEGSSQCEECFGKGWNDVFHKVAGHYEGGEVFQDECEACGGTGAAAPAPVALTPAQQHADRLLSALSDIAYGLERARIWGGMKWEYNPLHPVHYIPLRDKARTVIKMVESTSQEGTA